MENPLVSVVIPTFNRKNALLGCLRSLSNSSYNKMEIIVADNASIDGTSEAIQKLCPYVKLVKLEKNTGVTGGRNAGAMAAIGELVLFLDHDMIVDKNMIEKLVGTMLRDQEIGVSGPIIYYYDDPGRIWAAGTSINMLTGRVSFNTSVNREDLFDVQVLPAAFMIKRNVLSEVGLFDDSFFATYEDTDFCFRVRKADYRVVCVPKAKAWHKVPLYQREQTLGVLRRAYYVARNRIIFMKKNAQLFCFLLFLAIFMPIYAIYYTAQSVKFGRLRFAWSYWRGVIDGISGRAKQVS